MRTLTLFVALVAGAVSARADSITSEVVFDLAGASPVTDTAQVSAPTAGSQTSASLTVPSGAASDLRAVQVFSGSGAKGFVTAGSLFASGGGRNFLTATNVLELEIGTAGTYDFTFLITGGVLRLGDFANPSTASDFPVAGFSATVDLLRAGTSTQRYSTSASYTLGARNADFSRQPPVLTVTGPDIALADFDDVDATRDYNVLGKSIPVVNPTIDLGLLAVGDIVRYTLIAEGSARGNETGFFTLVNDPNDLTSGLVPGASLVRTGDGVAPIPEPGTLALVASGLVGGIWLRRRRHAH